MKGESRRPPQATGSQKVNASTDTSLRPADDIPAQIRRRRAASRRLEELADGRRDPLDRRKPRRPVRLRAVGRFSVEFEGPGVIDAIRTLDIPRMRSRFGGGWLVHEGHADDVEALLSSRGFRIEITL